MPTSPRFPGTPVDLRRVRGHRLGRDSHQRGRLLLSDYALDHNACRLPGGGRGRSDEPVGNAPRIPRARERALVGDGRRGVRPGRRPRCQLHGWPGPDPDEGGPLRHRRQAVAGRLPRRRSSAHQPEPEHPCRARRRDGRCRLRLGNPLRSERAGSGGLHRHRPTRRGGDEHAVLRRSGWLPHDPHARERKAARGRSAPRVRRRSSNTAHQPVRTVHRDHERRRRQPGCVHARQDRPARVLRPARAKP